MRGLLILFIIVGFLMLICAIVWKCIFEAHARSENRRRQKREKTKTEDLKDRFK